MWAVRATWGWMAMLVTKEGEVRTRTFEYMWRESCPLPLLLQGCHQLAMVQWIKEGNFVQQLMHMRGYGQIWGVTVVLQYPSLLCAGRRRQEPSQCFRRDLIDLIIRGGSLRVCGRHFCWKTERRELWWERFYVLCGVLSFAGFICHLEAMLRSP